MAGGTAWPLLLVHECRPRGPRELGMQSLPVAFGTTTASYICCATIDVTQLSVAAYLYLGLGEPIYALVLLGLTLPQVPPSRFFLSSLFCPSHFPYFFCVCSLWYALCSGLRSLPGRSWIVPAPALTAPRLQRSRNPSSVHVQRQCTSSAASL